MPSSPKGGRCPFHLGRSRKFTMGRRLAMNGPPRSICGDPPHETRSDIQRALYYRCVRRTSEDAVKI
jgi:hypothetical protein